MTNTKVLLYGEPPFALFYLKASPERWVGLDLQQFRPDPRLYLKKNYIYSATITEKNGDTCMIIKNKKYKILFWREK